MKLLDLTLESPAANLALDEALLDEAVAAARAACRPAGPAPIMATSTF